MDGKDIILQTILSEAEDYYNKTVAKADEDYQNQIDEAKCRADSMISDAKAELDSQEVAELNRKKVVAKLDGKKVHLSKMSDAVSEVFDRALHKLENLDKSAYKSIIVKLIEQNAEENDVITLSSKAPFGLNEIASLDIVKAKNIKVTMSDKIGGGIIIERQNMDINFTFESIIDGLKEKLQSQVYSDLFD